MKSELAWEIGETANALRRFYDRRASKLGVTRAQWRLMAMLNRHPGLKQVSLAERLDIEPITLSRTLDRLEELGLVRRLPDPADRRAWRLELTEQASPLMASLRELADEMAEVAFAEIDDVESIRTALAIIRSNICERDETPRKTA